MAREVPNSYKDPYWQNLAEQAEVKTGIPSGLLRAIINQGERSNNNQVSEAGARSPFQIIPATRDAIIRKYGIDPYASPEEAAEGAALLLKEGLDRNRGSIAETVGEYHGGIDRKNWGPRTKAYIQRVAAVPDQQAELLAKFNAWKAERQANAPVVQSAQADPANQESDVLAKFNAWKASKQQVAQQGYGASGSFEAEQQQPGLIDRIGRQVGLTARSGIEGLASLPALIADPAIALANMALPENMQQKSMTQATSDLLTSAGLPTAGSPEERIVGQVIQAVSGSGGLIKAGEKIAEKAIKPSVKAVGQFLASAPAVQLAGAGGGSAAQQAVAESGGGAGSQIAANVAGSLLGGASATLRGGQAAAKTAATGAPQTSSQDIAELTRKAAGGGIGSGKAERELAMAAKIDVSAKKAADDLGIEIPADVFSNEPAFMSAVGLSRSVAGSNAEAQWARTVKKTSEQADDLMQKMDASPDVASVSDDVSQRLIKFRDSLENQAAKLYKEVDESVPPKTLIQLENTKNFLANKAEELGGVKNLSTAEKKLFNLVFGSGFESSPNQTASALMAKKTQNVTYAKMMREKNVLGQMIKDEGKIRGDDVPASVRELYGTIAQDQIENVKRLAVPDVVDKLESANYLWGKERNLSKQIINAYGKDTNGSIASLMKSAVKNASQGDVKSLNKLLELIPTDLQKKTIMTAIADLTRSKAANSITNGGFGFSEFNKFYEGLSRNQSLKNKIGATVGGDVMRNMETLNDISKRMTEARARVSTTGKANQGIKQAIEAQGAFGRLMDIASGPIGRTAGAGLGALFGGPVGAIAASGISNMLKGSNKQKLGIVGDMFVSDKFQKMLIDAADNKNIKMQMDAFSKTPEYRKFSNLIRLNAPKKLTEEQVNAIVISAILGQKTEETKENQ